MGFLEAIETEEQIKNAVKVLSPMPVSPSVAQYYTLSSTNQLLAHGELGI